MRLDAYIVQNGMIKGREHAKELIKSGGIAVNGKTEVKPSAEVTESDDVVIIGETLKYVGRGGLKLEKAIDVFNIDLNGRTCVDFGASTGGFTDCMLQNGAACVYAVDVGHGQLDKKLASDSRVINMEGVNIKNITVDDFDGRADFIGCDVSFISLKHIIPKIAEVLSTEGEAAVLIKPQFECGRSDIGKRGIVRSEKVHLRVLNEISAAFQASGLIADMLDYSPISGGDGNIEYICHAVFPHKANMLRYYPEITVKAAFAEL